VLVCVLISVGCSDAPSAIVAPAIGNPMATALRAGAPSAAPQAAMNTDSMRVANLIPGFGGAFVANGELNVYLTSDVDDAQGQATARAGVSNVFAAGHRPLMPIKFLSAKYSFAQLRSRSQSRRQRLPSFLARRKRELSLNGDFMGWPGRDTGRSELFRILVLPVAEYCG